MSNALVFCTLTICGTALMFGSVVFESLTLFWSAVVLAVLLLLV